MPGHCQIVLAEHMGSVRRALEDDVLVQEVRNWKKCLIRMFREWNDQGVIFMDISLGETTGGCKKQKKTITKTQRPQRKV